MAEEIEWCRVQRATLMLRESRMSVKEIGYATGFAGSRRLIRAFQRLHHITPSQFRQEAKR